MLQNCTFFQIFITHYTISICSGVLKWFASPQWALLELAGPLFGQYYANYIYYVPM